MATIVKVRGGGDAELVAGAVGLGAAVLEVTRRPKHCLGIYADVRQPGRVVVGDPVLLSLSEPA